MPFSTYRFHTRWTAPARPPQVYAVIEKVYDYPRWWPAVWLKVEQVSPENDRGVGGVYRLVSKGWLPYILHWTTTTEEKRPHERIRLSAAGDFRGSGTWTFRADGPNTVVEYLWEIEAEKPLLKYLSFALKPIFRANHNWAMATGEASLKIELQRQTTGPFDPPPPPTFLSRNRRRALGLA